MNSYVGVKLFLSNHAYAEYCQRVELIERELLQTHFQQQLHDGNFNYDKKSFIHLDGVWWVYDMKQEGMLMVTCYGKTTMDVPRALRWARNQGDRIDLSNMIYAGVAE